MSDELLAIGDRVVAMAGPGEQVEAVVSRGRDTEIKVYDGEIESLSSAQSQGVGIRVIADGRQGFAYAATFDDDVLAETLAEARDNAGFATPDEYLGLAEPDGVPVAELDLFSEALEAFPTDAKVELAIELERAVQGGRPAHLGHRVGRVRRRHGRGRHRQHHRHPHRRSRDRLLRHDLRHGGRGRRHADRLRVLGRARAGRARRGPRRGRGRRPGHPHARRGQAPERAAHASCSTRGSPPSSSASSPTRSTARPCSRVARCSPTAWATRSPRRSSRWSTTPPTPTPSPPPRPTARAWPPAATCSSRAGC